MKTCDCCGDIEVKLHELKEEYQLHDVKEVCEECLDTINRFHSRINSILISIWTESRESALKRFIRKLSQKVAKIPKGDEE